MGTLEKLLLSVKETAAFLGICSKSVYNLTKQGILKPVPVLRNRVLYDIRDLMAFVDSQKKS